MGMGALPLLAICVKSSTTLGFLSCCRKAHLAHIQQ